MAAIKIVVQNGGYSVTSCYQQARHNIPPANAP
jgi:hypothetical protein